MVIIITLITTAIIPEHFDSGVALSAWALHMHTGVHRHSRYYGTKFSDEQTEAREVQWCT